VISQIGEAQFVAWAGESRSSCRSFWSSSASSRDACRGIPLFLAIANRRKQLSQAPCGRHSSLQNADAAGLPREGLRKHVLYLFSTFLLLLATGYLNSLAARVERAHDRLMFEVFVILAAARISDSVGRRPCFWSAY